MIVQLGLVQFDVNFGYETLEQTRRWVWSNVDVIGDYPILQFAGKTAELSFQGTYYNYVADADAPIQLEELAEAGESHGLTDDLGNFYGFWVITALSRAERFFRAEQKTGLQTRWNLTLQYYGKTKER